MLKIFSLFIVTIVYRSLFLLSGWHGTVPMVSLSIAVMLCCFAMLSRGSSIRERWIVFGFAFANGIIFPVLFSQSGPESLALLLVLFGFHSAALAVQGFMEPVFFPRDITTFLVSAGPLVPILYVARADLSFLGITGWRLGLFVAVLTANVALATYSALTLAPRLLNKKGESTTGRELIPFLLSLVASSFVALSLTSRGFGASSRAFLYCVLTYVGISACDLLSAMASIERRRRFQFARARR